MNETIGLIIMGVGVAFDLFGCVGLIRLPDVYNRLQAATKCVTLGTCLLLLGGCIYVGGGALGVKASICAVFLLLTSPVAAHAISRGAYKSGVALWEGSVVDRYAEDHMDDRKPSPAATTREGE